MNIFRRICRFNFFIAIYIVDLMVANFRVAYDIMTIRQHYRDGVIKVKIGQLSSMKRALLMNLITMTPGTICLNFDEVKMELTIHVMFMDGAEKVISKIQNTYLPFIREVLP